ncbi:hypothetical protein FACS189494_07040 [Spirochaetia bacterium]|nr:hypothetical protein FACS189494_07040 [Spirochaetia bacterium]
MINLEELAKPLESGAGEDLEYDPLYLEMDSLAVDVPDSVSGESKIEGRSADWKKLRENCTALWGKTRDLRVATYLTIAETALGGIHELACGLKLIHFLINDMWDDFYPKLDTDDDNDPLERINILAMLSPESGAINDPVMFISRLREMRLVPSLSYSVRDLLISLNEIESSDDGGRDPKLIGAELLGVVNEVLSQAQAVADSLETIKALCACANGKISGGYIISMDALTKELKTLKTFFDETLARAEGIAASGTDDANGAGAGSGTHGAAGNPGGDGGTVQLASFKPQSRAQALLLLRKGAEYFQAHEPASPIPLLVQRALRFSEMSFIDLLQDIAPDALPRGKDILGIKDEQQ